MNQEWKRTNKLCSKCSRHLYERLFSSRVYSQGDLICPTHGQISKGFNKGNQE